MNYLEKTFGIMATDALAYARKNESVWNDISVIGTEILNAEQKNAALGEAFHNQSREDSSGMVDHKNFKTKNLASDVYKLECKLSFLAKKTGNNILLKEVSDSEYDLKHLSDSLFLTKCRTIAELGQSYLSQEYKITADEVNGILANLAEATSLCTQVDLAKNGDKMSTQAIKTLIPEVRNVLELLDDAFEGMITDDAFLNGWWAIRKIKGRSRGKKKDDDTSNPPTPSPEK